MRVLSISLAAAVALLGGLFGWQTAHADELTVMVEDASEPFSRSDGTGYANDIVRAAFKAAGVDVRLNVVPYARCKASVIAGRVAACFSISREELFDGKVAFSKKPIFEVQAAIFELQNAPNRFASLESIPGGAQLGIVNSYEYPTAIERLGEKGIVFERAVDELVNLKKLAQGRLTAAVVMTSKFESRERRADDAGVQQLVSYAFTAGSLGSYIGFSTQHPDGAWARVRFDTGHEAIMSNGTQAAIEQQWLQNVRK